MVRAGTNENGIHILRQAIQCPGRDEMQELLLFKVQSDGYTS